MTAKHIQEAWDKLRQERDELAAQVEAMRAALDGAAEYTALLDDFTQEAIREALALPSHAAAILRQRDARTVRTFAVAMSRAGAEFPLPYGEWYAKELERENA